MSTTKPSHPVKQPKVTHPANSTDATRGEPIALRAQKRKAELEAALAVLPTTDLRARNDIEIALASVGELLTGDTEHVSHVTAAELSRWIENTKHLAEPTPKVRRRSGN